MPNNDMGIQVFVTEMLDIVLSGNLDDIDRPCRLAIKKSKTYQGWTHFLLFIIENYVEKF